MTQLYFEGFETGTVGSLPIGAIVNDANFSPVVGTVTTFAGSQNVKVKMTTPGGGNHYIYKDTTQVPSAGNYTAEGVYYWLADQNQRSGVAFRGTSTTGTAPMYAMMLRVGTTMRLSYISGSAETVKTTVNGQNYGTGVYYHVKASADCSAIKGRWWADG